MFGRFFDRCVCADGFSMSVQAHYGAYCSPRVDGASHYDSVEVGLPSEVEPLLIKWAEDADRPTDTIYAWVPASIIRQVIEKHGGMVGGEVPPGV